MKIARIIPVEDEKAIAITPRGESKLVSLKDETAHFWNKHPLMELSRDDIISNLSDADVELDNVLAFISALDSFIADKFIQDDDLDEYTKDNARNALRLLDKITESLDTIQRRIGTSTYAIMQKATK
jgi:hypothetical protein